MRIKHVIPLLLFSILFYSCEADIDLKNISNEVSLHPNLIIPIGGANLTLGQILSRFTTNGKVQYGTNNEVDFVKYDTTIFKFRSLNFLQNPVELSKTLNFGITTETQIPANSQLPELNSTGYINVGLSTSSDQIDSIVVNSATLSIQLDASSDLQNIDPSNTKISIIFPNGTMRKLDGSSGNIQMNPSAFGVSTDLKLSNFVLNLRGNQFSIPIQLKIEINSGTKSITLKPESNISYKLSLKNINYKVAYGYFALNSTATTTYQEKIDLDKNLPLGNYDFINPQIEITTVSNIGAYMDFSINYVKAYSTTNPDYTPVYASFDGNKSFSFQYDRKPTHPGDTIKNKLRTLDKNWGSTNQLFVDEQRPDILEYNFNASIDSTLTKVSKTPGFITPDGNITVYIKTTVPIYLEKGSYYQYKDSIMNIFEPIASTLDRYSLANISSAALVLNITNGLPVKSVLTLEMVDSLGIEIPTDFQKSYTIQSGRVDAQGLVQPGNETKQTLTISLTKDQLPTLRKAKKILYKVVIDGDTDDSSIHFTANNSFNIQVGLFVKGELKTTLGGK